MIHKFEINGIKLVLDVHSGTLHQVDELCWHILDDYRKYPKGHLINKYSCHYNREEVQEAANEISQLEKDGFLFSDERPCDIDGLFDNSAIKSLCLHISHDCNLRCKYCFAGQGSFGREREVMSVDIAKKAVDFLIEKSAGRKNIEIDFFGGEPLLNFEATKAVVNYGYERAKDHNKNIKFTLTTNALMLHEEIEKFLFDNNVSLVLSLDGRKEVHDKMRPKLSGKGSYEDIIKNIKRTVNRKPTAGYYIRGTYTKHNLDFVNDVMHMLEYNFFNVSVEPVVTENPDYAIEKDHLYHIKKEYIKLADEILKLEIKKNIRINFFHFNIDSDGPCFIKRLSGCGAGYEYLAVAPNGCLYPCHQFVGKDEFIIGHVEKVTINEKISSRFKSAHIYNKTECRQCWAKYYCSGGCHASAYMSNKDILKPYRLGCDLMKIRLECALYLKAKRFEISVDSIK